MKHIRKFNESENMKDKETLEEAAKRTYQKGLQDDIDLSFYDGVRLGAKWQQERMYSEEDMREAWENGRNGTEVVGSFPFVTTKFKYKSFEKWFEQFKK
jgi:hypothetical protein